MRPFASLHASAALAACALTTGLAAQQPARAPAAARSAAVTDLRYELTFDSATARRNTIAVSLALATGGKEPVLLSFPTWTPVGLERR